MSPKPVSGQRILICVILGPFRGDCWWEHNSRPFCNDLRDLRRFQEFLSILWPVVALRCPRLLVWRELCKRLNESDRRQDDRRAENLADGLWRGPHLSGFALAGCMAVAVLSDFWRKDTLLFYTYLLRGWLYTLFGASIRLKVRGSGAFGDASGRPLFQRCSA